MDRINAFLAGLIVMAVIATAGMYRLQDAYVDRMIALHERVQAAEDSARRNQVVIAELVERIDESLGGYEQAMKVAAGAPRRK